MERVEEIRALLARAGQHALEESADRWRSAYLMSEEVEARGPGGQKSLSLELGLSRDTVGRYVRTWRGFAERSNEMSFWAATMLVKGDTSVSGPSMLRVALDKHPSVTLRTHALYIRTRTNTTLDLVMNLLGEESPLSTRLLAVQAVLEKASKEMETVAILASDLEFNGKTGGPRGQELRKLGVVPHGTVSGYRYHRCRCDLCRTAQNKSARAFYQKHRTKILERNRVRLASKKAS